MRNKLSYDVIFRVKQRDDAAIQELLKHYEPIIVDASKLLKKNSKNYLVETVNEDIRAFIECELVLAIINTYDPFRTPSGGTFKITE